MINPTHKQLFKTAINNLHKKINPNIMSIINKTAPSRPQKQQLDTPLYNIEHIVPEKLLNDFEKESQSVPINNGFTYYYLDPIGEIIQDTNNDTYEHAIYKHFENKTTDYIVIDILNNIMVDEHLEIVWSINQCSPPIYNHLLDTLIPNRQDFPLNKIIPYSKILLFKKVRIWDPINQHYNFIYVNNDLRIDEIRDLL
jgi:hypothetical protein